MPLMRAKYRRRSDGSAGVGEEGRFPVATVEACFQDHAAKAPETAEPAVGFRRGVSLGVSGMHMHAYRAESLVQRALFGSQAVVNQSDEGKFVIGESIADGRVTARRIPAQEPLGRQPHARQVIEAFSKRHMPGKGLNDVAAARGIEYRFLTFQEMGEGLAVRAITQASVDVLGMA